MPFGTPWFVEIAIIEAGFKGDTSVNNTKSYRFTICPLEPGFGLIKLTQLCMGLDCT